MSSNPPLPYETITETEYAGWYEMINSIVSFVTASTQLASSLRNSRGSFPIAGELTDQRREKRENPVMFNLLDFPWFLNELKDITLMNDISLPQFTIAEYVPLVQYPFLDIIRVEPNNEPRTFTLVDTRDFGDVEPRRSSDSVINIHTPKRSFGFDKTKPYMKYKNSNDSCFFEEYSDSEQTIDSSNLQEKFETEKDVDGCSRRNSRLTENNRNFVHSDESVKKHRNCDILDKTEEEEQLSTIYDEPEYRNSKNVELFMECTVEDTLVKPKKKKVSNENVYVYEAGNVVSTCSEIVQAEKILDTQDVGTDYIIGLNDLFLHSTQGTQADLLLFPQVPSEDKNIQVKRKKKDRSKSRVSDKDKTGLKHNDIGKSKISLISDGNITATKSKIQKKSENEIIAECTLAVKSVKLQEKSSLKKKIPDAKVSAIKTKNIVENKQSKKEVLSAREIKREKEGEIDYITKNIVNCLNIAKKPPKSPTVNQKLVNKTPIKSLNNILKEAELNKSITPNIQSQILASVNATAQSRKPTNKKSLSVDTVNPKESGKEALLPKKLTGTKKPIAKTASNNETTTPKFQSPIQLAKSIIQSAEKTQEIKSCLRTANAKNLGSQKICIIRDDMSTCGEKKGGTVATFSRSKDNDSVMPKMLIIRDTTLKLSAAENIKKASELLKNVEEKVLKSTVGVKRQVVSGAIRPTTAEPGKKR